MGTSTTASSTGMNPSSSPSSPSPSSTIILTIDDSVLPQAPFTDPSTRPQELQDLLVAMGVPQGSIQFISVSPVAPDGTYQLIVATTDESLANQIQQSANNGDLQSTGVQGATVSQSSGTSPAPALAPFTAFFLLLAALLAHL